MRHRRTGSRIRVIPLLRKQRGAVALEYLLVLGVAAVLMGVTIYWGVASVVPQAVGMVCPTVDTAYYPAPVPAGGVPPVFNPPGPVPAPTPAMVGNYCLGPTGPVLFPPP